MTTINDLNELLPEVRSRAEALLAAAEAAGLKVRIIETYRSYERQAELYAQSRTKPGPRVTNARAGSSWHQWRRAFDVVFWHDQPWGEQHPWQQLGELGEAAGLDWGGRWTKPDRPHFELPGVCSRGLRIEALDGLLKQGAEGPPVEELQARLRTVGIDPGPVDGRFGPRTAAAVRQVQERAGLPVTGAVDLDTIEVLEALLATASDPSGREERERTPAQEGGQS